MLRFCALFIALAAPLAGRAQPFSPYPADTLAAWLRASNPHGPTVSAHRGGPTDSLPENALATFARTNARFGPPILLETDVRLTADSVLVLMHDEELDRTTTGTGLLAETPFATVQTLHLRNARGETTPFAVPTLDTLLAWARGRAVLTLEPKRDVPEAVFVRALRAANAEGFVVVITYTPEQYARYLALAPDLVYSVTVDSDAALDRLLGVPGAIPCRWIAFVGTDAPDVALNARLRKLNVRPMQGVFGAEANRAAAEGPAALAPLRAALVDVITTSAVEAAALLPPPSPSQTTACAAKRCATSPDAKTACPPRPAGSGRGPLQTDIKHSAP